MVETITIYLNRVLYPTGEIVSRLLRRYIMYILLLFFSLPLALAAAEFLFMLNGFTEIADFIRYLYSFNCHQKSSRCPTLLSQSLIICYRCSGIYTGLVIGWVIAGSVRINTVNQRILFWLIVAVIINLTDIISGALGFWQVPESIRFTLGIIFGFPPGYFVTYQINTISKSRQK
ncbi:MAG: DUF2085 domain-containing protein [candidate division Zixibacteria bacterium]|nr:DUF2085 domain-containing protein [candidate division Zixibacteria bacterium]